LCRQAIGRRLPRIIGNGFAPGVGG
jgi:hypothetical protein